MDYEAIWDKGLSEEAVRYLSKQKNEPEWMLELRLKAFEWFKKLELPPWVEGLEDLNYDEIIYYLKPKAEKAQSWEELPEDIRKIYDQLGIPEAEKKYLAGVTAQFESSVLYEKVEQYLAEKGVIFISLDEAVQKYPELVRKYFAKLVPINDNKFAALNTAFWSGGVFLYVPKGVKVDRILQAYFRIQMQSLGQFERTLIIVEEDAEVSYVEGCSAPIYSKASLHAAVVEVFAHKRSRVRYTTVQNWSKNVYNLVTKRGMAYEGAYIEWLDGNMGSKVTYKYPGIILKEPYAKAKILSIASASSGQLIDSGGKAIHLAPHTSSTIISKSISMGSGISKYRGWIKVAKGAKHAKVSVNCDALLLDKESRTDTYPNIDIHEKDTQITHEATVGKIEEEQLFYLMSRGFDEETAKTMIVMGFVEEFIKEIPLEYAVELNRLIKLEMEGSIG
ncbi:MAG: Fe-S cluster assembly protein SufB [Candidatus Micrarchaeota archaeon]|nr:Fe-S cluster assembly protein SufB [Candidatus Micrarchaeota archaeon]